MYTPLWLHGSSLTPWILFIISAATPQSMWALLLLTTSTTAWECVYKHVPMYLSQFARLCWWPRQQVGELPGVSQFWWEDQRQVGLSLAWCVQINELSLTHISCYCCCLGQAGNRDTELARTRYTHLYCPANVSHYHAMPVPSQIRTSIVVLLAKPFFVVEILTVIILQIHSLNRKIG